MSQAKGWRSIVAIVAVVGGICAATYPIMVAPYINPEPWRQKQDVGRVGIDREKIQPGGMKVWTDPFNRKEE
ncbi:small integral membrane protein 20-like [Babylonia areolata]|uniref:small integral membrane protein 20-like n=1 Tax=Babylonia areolata TaxID=304850 RepID=UPI003FD04BBE